MICTIELKKSRGQTLSLLGKRSRSLLSFFYSSVPASQLDVSFHFQSFSTPLLKPAIYIFPIRKKKYGIDRQNIEELKTDSDMFDN